MSAPQEQSPRFAQKTKWYILSTFGAVSLLFLVLFLSEKMRGSAPSTPPSPETIQETGPSDLTSQTFEAVGKTRPKAPDTFNVASSLQHQAASLLPDLPGLSDPLEQEKAQQKALEYKRAALASRSVWQLEQEKPPSSPATKKSSAIEAPPDEWLSSDDQRKMIAKRLQEMASLRQQIESGNYSAVEAQRKHQTLETLEQSFSPPPPQIVGFTKENQYNASTEGLLKLPIGSLIPAITITKANSDNTGTFKALVSQDIFDTTYEYVLIPKGAEVILKSVKVTGSNEAVNYRLGITVPWIVLPNGNKVDLSKSTGLDREGLSGMSDQVDRHLLAQFMGVAAYALVANGTRYESGVNDAPTYTGELSQGVREQLSPLAQKYLALTPTITIRSGLSMNIIVEDEIYLMPWRHIYEDYL
ncbi:TrbI/VirB10 family protein [Vibrio vulnificus]|nr:TrbI/VirB10 family protein [Vibrio vulnificus]